MREIKVSRATDETLLRELAERDSDLLFRWINDRELVVLNAPFRPISQVEHAAWFENVRKAGDARIFAIADPELGRTIGYCQLIKIDPQRREAELQIRIGDRTMHGRGLGTAAVRELLHIAFEDLDLQRIRLQVFHDNVRAIRSYVKCGFKLDSTLKNAIRIEGQLKDIHNMSVDKAGFSASANSQGGA